MSKFITRILIFFMISYLYKEDINDYFLEEINYKKLNNLNNITKIQLSDGLAYISNSNKNNNTKYKLIIGNNKLFDGYIKKKLYKIDITYKSKSVITFIINRILIIITINYFIKLIFHFSHDKANYKEKKKSNIKFKDVIGLDEVKEEVNEFIDILKNNKKYLKMKCKIPKGILFYGRPGVGKTLLAKAIANEANLTFLYTNGSSFNEVYVGVGQARVKQLFENARSKKPCIIFIDEIDTLGRKRSTQTGYSESENTLNSLLAEMDGIDNNDNILVIGSTNRPEILDNALLRPGRFDRKVEFNLPNLIEREKLFKYYLTKYKIDEVDNISKAFAEKTFSLSSADISNVCNEAAIKTVKNEKEVIDLEDLDKALEYVLVGNKRLSSKLTEEDKKTIAYHEIGHAFMSYILKNVQSPIKISIIPTTKGALGFSMSPNEEKKLVSKNEMLEQMAVLLGGRCSEQYFLDKITTGASNDLEKLKHLQLSYIKVYGFSDKYLHINLEINISENTKRLIDDDIFILNNKIISFINKCFQGNSSKIKNCIELLINKEEINGIELKEILGEELENSINYEHFNSGY